MNLELATFLESTRRMKGETQGTAAKACGVCRFTWASWEGGHVPRADKFQWIAAWAGVTTDEILRRASQKNNSQSKAALSVLGHVRQTGPDGICFGELRNKLTALSESDLKEAIAFAEKSYGVVHRGRGKTLRYYHVEAEID